MNPFDALGLPAAQLTDEQVRSAWRQAAAATHPDRPGGGDPAACAAAAAAYAQLRTPWGRSEALADLAADSQPGALSAQPADAPGTVGAAWASARLLPARVARGRPGRLAARTVAAVAVAVLAVTVTGGTPSAPAIVTGCALWWALSARGDLAPPPGR